MEKKPIILKPEEFRRPPSSQDKMFERFPYLPKGINFPKRPGR